METEAFLVFPPKSLNMFLLNLLECKDIIGYLAIRLYVSSVLEYEGQEVDAALLFVYVLYILMLARSS